MTGETQITVVGNLTSDPELKFIQSGAAVANFTVASTPRRFDKQTNEFVDGDTLFMRCSLWRDYAEHVAESLTKGMRVVVTGALVQRSWGEGEDKRTVMEMQVEEIGPALRYATAKVTRVERGARAAQPSQAAPSWQNDTQQQSSQSDPWASAPAPVEPPF